MKVWSLSVLLAATTTGLATPNRMEARIPLIRIPAGVESKEFAPPVDISRSVVEALQNSGFLLIATPLLPNILQTQALEAATEFLERPGKNQEVITHPIDPKIYTMLESQEKCASASPILAEYFDAMEKTKVAVLRLIAVGLGLDPSYFTCLHSKNNDTLRLIRYQSGTEKTGNRCKEHSDYGTLTLLSADGVSGLEAFHRGKWLPVPYVEGSLVVNIGTLMSHWSGGSLLATLHRVAGPASDDSCSEREDLLQAIGRARTSIAFFVDPNEEVAASLMKGREEKQNGLEDALKGLSVAEYIQWRSGGGSANRSGIGFTEIEERRVKGS